MMSLFRHASIRTKLSLALGAALSLIVAVGLFDVLQLQHVNETTKDIREHWLPKIQTLDEMKRNAAEYRILGGGRLQTTNFRQIAAISQRMQQTGAALERAEQSLALMPNLEIEKAHHADFRRLWNVYGEAYQAALRRSESGEATAAQVDFD